MLCSQEQGEGVEPVHTFFEQGDRGRGSVFFDFVRTSFMDGP